MAHPVMPGHEAVEKAGDRRAFDDVRQYDPAARPQMRRECIEKGALVGDMVEAGEAGHEVVIPPREPRRVEIDRPDATRPAERAGGIIGIERHPAREVTAEIAAAGRNVGDSAQIRRIDVTEQGAEFGGASIGAQPHRLIVGPTTPVEDLTIFGSGCRHGVTQARRPPEFRTNAPRIHGTCRAPRSPAAPARSRPSAPRPGRRRTGCRRRGAWSDRTDRK